MPPSLSMDGYGAYERRPSIAGRLKTERFRLPSRPAIEGLLTVGLEPVQRLLEAVGVRAFGLRQRLEPVRDLREAFFPRRLRHTRVHVGVLVRLARNGGLEIQLRVA